MKFLITNDDGIHAPGLAALEAAASEFGSVVVVAPEVCNSSCGHQATTSRPLKVRPLDPQHFAVDGTPVDCVRVALLHLVPDADWVLSGVNAGGNLGVDVHMSGTVAAVRESMLLGRRGIAFSQYRKSRQFLGWSKAIRMTTRVLQELLPRGCEPRSYWNVNFPDESGEDLPLLREGALDPQPLPLALDPVENEYHYRSNYQQRPRLAGHDVDLCFSGHIALTQVRHALG
jgi:5'-nucleotidase